MKVMTMLMKSDKNALLVVKVSGKKLNDLRVWKDIAEARRSGMQIAVVHGGGVQIDEAMKKEGLEVKTLGGYRVTCDRTMTVVEKEMKRINTDIVRTLFKENAQPLGFGYGTYFGYVMGEQWGRYGAITDVRGKNLITALKNGWTPVVSPIGMDHQDGKLNLDADECAASLAVALGAREAILVSDVAGIKAGDGRLIRKLGVHGLLKLLEDKIVINGMIPKVKACVEGAMHGVVMKIVDGNVLDVLNGADAGTEITPHN